MRNRRRIVITFAVVFGLVLMSPLLWAMEQPQNVRAHLAPFDDALERHGSLFIDSSVDVHERQALSWRIFEAQLRVERLFGARKAQPWILAIEDMSRLAAYSSNSYAVTHASPLGGSIIVLGPHGITSTDVIAHELAHAEHVHRSGYVRYARSPTWFREGLAMLVDHRRDYVADRWPETDLSSVHARDLGDAATFFGGNGQLHYTVARDEVRRWHDRCQCVSEFLDQEPLTKSFDAYYDASVRD